MRTTSLAAMILAAGASLSACAPYTTYPPQNRVLGPGSVVDEPVPTLIVKAIDHADTRHGAGQPDPAINLPAGTAPRLYEKVIARLGRGHPMRHADEPAFHVMRVAARGSRATVDLFVPTEQGHDFVTLTFRHELVGGYVVEAMRVWETGDLPPGPNYVAVEQTAVGSDTP